MLGGRTSLEVLMSAPFHLPIPYVAVAKFRARQIMPEPQCDMCGHVWTDEERNFDFVKRHMVAVHGYKQVARQVFRSTPCVACIKPGLYRVGGVAYCLEHRDLAVTRTTRRRNLLDGARIEREKLSSDTESRLRKKDSLHRLTLRRRYKP
jgi:hypothetical protein